MIAATLARCYDSVFLRSLAGTRQHYAVVQQEQCERTA